MGFEVSTHDASEYTASAPITKKEAAAIVANRGVARIHVYSLATADARFWDALNDAVFAHRPDIYLSVGGFLSSKVDLGFARHMSHVRRFGLHGAEKLSNVEALAALPHLEQLYLNGFTLTSFDFLSQLSPDIVELTLLRTRSKKPSLAPLARFRKLRSLYVEGHERDIEILGELTALEELTLRSITVEDFNWIRRLKKLWSLDIKLGGAGDFSALAGMRSIKYLELWQILGLDSLEIVGELSGLQNLFLQSLKRVHQLDPLTRAKKLRRVYIENLTSVTSLAPLRDCRNLEEFGLSDEKGQWQPEDLIPVLANRRIRAANVSMWSKKKDARLDELLHEYGKRRYEYEPFVYR